MSRPGEAEAVDAAMRGFRAAKDPDGIIFPTFERRIQEAVAAAYPTIAAAIREQVARDIEAQASPLAAGDNLNRVIAAGYAAAIARGLS